MVIERLECLPFLNFFSQRLKRKSLLQELESSSHVPNIDKVEYKYKLSYDLL